MSAFLHSAQAACKFPNSEFTPGSIGALFTYISISVLCWGLFLRSAYAVADLMIHVALGAF